MEHPYPALRAITHNLSHLFFTYSEIFHAFPHIPRSVPHARAAARLSHNLGQAAGLLDTFIPRFGVLSTSQARAIYTMVAQFLLTDLFLPVLTTLACYEDEVPAEYRSCKALHICSAVVALTQRSLSCDDVNLALIERTLNQLSHRISVLSLANRPSYMEFRVLSGHRATDFPLYRLYHEARRKDPTLQGRGSHMSPEQSAAELADHFALIHQELLLHGREVGVAALTYGFRYPTSTYKALQEVTRLQGLTKPDATLIMDLTAVMIPAFVAVDAHMVRLMGGNRPFQKWGSFRTDFSKLIIELQDIQSVLGTETRVMELNPTYVMYLKLCKDEFVRVAEVVCAEARERKPINTSEKPGGADVGLDP